MHALSFKELFKVSIIKVFTFSISTCIISKNLILYPESHLREACGL